MKSVGPRILSSVFIVVGLVFLYLGVESLHTASSTTAWPIVQGRIISSEVQSKSSSNGGMSYHADLLYEYHVGDELFFSNTVSIGGFSWGGESHAQCIVARYPVGSEVTVHYCPDNPGSSVLEAGISGPTFLLPGAGGVFVLVGLSAFLRRNSV